MSTIEQRIYTLTDFNSIENTYNIMEFNENIINIINDLASKVGAPNYSKTPIFKKKRQKNYTNWETLRNFKKTELNKNNDCEYDKQINDYRMKFNKLTESNYNELSKQIILSIKEYYIKVNNDDILLEKIAKTLFEIGCLNSFWSKLYAKFFQDMIKEFPDVKNICIINFNNFLSLFENIEFIDINDNNYDLFCDNNKKNEKRRAMSSFFINLTNYKVIDEIYIYNLIFKLLNDIDYNKDNKDMLQVNEEIIENIFIMITNGKELLKESLKKWEKITTDITLLSKMKMIDYNGISRKLSFKCMDLLEELEE
tara:strand:+ start:8733 stop:9665 length:933 start_codon:yes stop_codon:yes gene_type:complete